jgi:hypothetical protein
MAEHALAISRKLRVRINSSHEFATSDDFGPCKPFKLPSDQPDPCC